MGRATWVLPAALVAVWWLGAPAASGAWADVGAGAGRVVAPGPFGGHGVSSGGSWAGVAPVVRLPGEDPVTLSREGQITDRVDALGDRRPEVVKALGRLDAEERMQLFVVYVRDFSGRSATEWADATARKNGLGRSDVLLAVATHERQYAYWVAADSRLTDAQLARVADTAVEPALRQNDWAGAAVGAADGFVAVLNGQPVPAPALTPGPSDPGGPESGAGDLVLPVVVLGGAAALGAYAYVRRSRRTRTRTTPQGGGGWSSGPPPPVPTAELDARARQALVDTDDALRTSQEELGFATAQFGEDAVKPFREAVDYAGTQLTAAFRLRQRLDDAHPEDEAERREMLDEIVTRCTEANRRLDAESDAFDRLRDLEQNAPEALAAAQRAYDGLHGRTITAEATLSVLRQRYAPSASAPVASGPEQAAERLLFALGSLERARTAVAEDDNGTAAVQIRAAEGALKQADVLMEAVDRRARELAEATGKLPGALTETDSDLAEARGLLRGTSAEESTASLQGRLARAEAVAAEVRREMAAGPHDPIDALRRVEEADAALDEALASARESEQGARRARTLLDRATLGARSSVGAASDYITTHRGAVGSEARTRLAEAQRRLRISAELAEGDAQGALAEAQRADALAREAQSLAESDVRGFGGGPFGPGGGSGRPGGGLGGAVLGGILLGGLFGGGGPGSGGGFGGSGGFGGGPGSFGGGGTRGRMGGGRF